MGQTFGTSKSALTAAPQIVPKPTHFETRRVQARKRHTCLLAITKLVSITASAILHQPRMSTRHEREKAAPKARLLSESGAKVGHVYENSAESLRKGL
jgi:hypothetical protein